MIDVEWHEWPQDRRGFKPFKCYWITARNVVHDYLYLTVAYYDYNLRCWVTYYGADPKAEHYDVLAWAVFETPTPFSGDGRVYDLW